MNFETIVFYAFAALIVFAALRVITARNPVHAVLFLVLAFISSAGIWILLEAEFLAITLVLVYVGAVMVLFLFVVMMLDINLVRLREGFSRWLPFGAALVGIIAFEIIWVLGSTETSDGKAAIKHYGGAAMVLFLFVVMMLDTLLVRRREGFSRWLPFGATLAGLMAFEMIWVLGSTETSGGKAAIKHAADYSNTKELGRLIYTDFVYPFEIAAVLLLVAMVAAIALTLRRRKDAKSQVISEQIAVKKADRLRIVSMQSEKLLAGHPSEKLLAGHPSERKDSAANQTN